MAREADLMLARVVGEVWVRRVAELVNLRDQGGRDDGDHGRVRGTAEERAAVGVHVQDDHGEFGGLGFVVLDQRQRYQIIKGEHFVLWKQRQSHRKATIFIQTLNSEDFFFYLLCSFTPYKRSATQAC